MDLADLRTDVRERIGEDSADFFTDDEVTRALNLAQTTFIAEEIWPWLFTEWETSISAGQQELELPSNVSIHRAFNVSVQGGSLVRGRMLERLTPEAGFRARYQYEEHDQTPMFYYLTSASVDSSEVLYVLRLVPDADVDYDITAQYLRVPADMSDSSDVPDLPFEFHPGISAWAAAHLFLKELDISQKAQEQFQLYFQVLAQARKLLEVHPDENIAWSREVPKRNGMPSLRDRMPLTLGP